LLDTRVSEEIDWKGVCVEKWFKESQSGKAEQELPNRVTFAHACELLAQVKTSSFLKLLQQKLKRVEF
jgi:hypothetical protein